MEYLLPVLTTVTYEIRDCREIAYKSVIARRAMIADALRAIVSMSHYGPAQIEGKERVEAYVVSLLDCLKGNKARRHKSRAPSNQRPTDQPTDQRTDRLTNRPTERLIESHARD